MIGTQTGRPNPNGTYSGAIGLVAESKADGYILYGNDLSVNEILQTNNP